MSERVAFWVRLTLAVLGIAGWITVASLLLSGPTHTVYAGSSLNSDEWTYKPDAELRCASVLHGPQLDPEDRHTVHRRSFNRTDEDVVVEDDSDRNDAASYGLQNDWATATCDRLRQRRIGQAMLVGFPSTALLAISFGVGGFRRP